jgi:hypothetical protein
MGLVVGLGLAELREVLAGGEGLSRPREEEGADLLILVGGLEGLKEGFQKLARDGVEPFGPVQGQDQDASLALRQDHGPIVKPQSTYTAFWCSVVKGVYRPGR